MGTNEQTEEELKKLHGAVISRTHCDRDSITLVLSTGAEVVIKSVGGIGAEGWYRWPEVAVNRNLTDKVVILG